jgi:charged multivesicular body protein 4A/B
MKRKKMYDMEIDKIQNVKMTLETQVIQLESAVVNQATVGAMSAGSKTMARLNKITSVEKVDAVMDSIKEEGDYLTDVSSAITQSVCPITADDDELLAELNELSGISAPRPVQQSAKIWQPVLPKKATSKVPLKVDTRSLERELAGLMH